MCGRRRDTKRDRSQIQCPNCIKYGHCERECWFKRKNVGDLHTKVSKRNCDTTETLLLTSHMTQEGPKNNWFLDIGCKLVAHVWIKRTIYWVIRVISFMSFHSWVKFGNNTKVSSSGRDTISIKLMDRSLNFIFRSALSFYVAFMKVSWALGNFQRKAMTYTDRKSVV